MVVLEHIEAQPGAPQIWTGPAPSTVKIYRSLLSHATSPLAAIPAAHQHGGVPCASITISTTSPAFEITRKRRKSFPSETKVKRGLRVVHGDVALSEKLGRNDLCPCGSTRRFQGVLHEVRPA